MQIREFLDFTKRHRLSTEQFNLLANEEDWITLTFEALWRNNSNLMSELYSLCPEEYKKAISDFVKHNVLSLCHIPQKPYSQTILKWVFNNLDIDMQKEIWHNHLANTKRFDLITFFIENNVNGAYDNDIYLIVEGVANEGDLDLFKKISKKINLIELGDRYVPPFTRNYSSKNVFNKLFSKCLTVDSYEFIKSKIKLTQDDYLFLIQECCSTLPNHADNAKNSEMLEYLLNDLKKNNYQIYNNFQNAAKNERYSEIRFTRNTAIQQCHVLFNHGFNTELLILRSINTIIYENKTALFYESLDYMYNNFPLETINKEFSNNAISTILETLIRDDHTREAKLMIQHNPSIFDEKFKNKMSKYLLNHYVLQGLGWAKEFLIESEINELIDTYKHNKSILEKLTLWKCENFIFNDEKKLYRPEKKKIKI